MTEANGSGPDDPPTDASLLDLDSATSTTRTVDGVDLHVVAAGDPDDPLVVLLHGFPEFWYAWRHQLPAIVDAGYRVLAPDQRGYNLSDRPEGIDAYRLGELSADVAGLIESEGRSSAHVVGHDWGANVSWELALRDPDVVDRLCTLNGGCLDAYWRTLQRSPRQLARSWYVALFQVPRLSEWVLERDGFAALRSSMAGGAAPGAFSDEELAAYEASWRQAGTVTGMVNWYRSLVRGSDDRPRETLEQPVKVVWGDRDSALVPSMADRSMEYCERGELQRFPDATHWLHHEEPGAVTDAVLAHL